jgi:transcription elongation factor GreA
LKNVVNMAKQKKYKVTPQGLEELKNELKERKTTVRKRLQDQLDQELEDGDISENSNYYKVQEEIASNDKRIDELEEIIDNVVLIEKDDCGSDNCKIAAGNTVKVKKEGEEITYTLVGATESDPSKNKISIESPLGQALNGKQKGDKAVLETPLGKQKYQILSVG